MKRLFTRTGAVVASAVLFLLSGVQAAVAAGAVSHSLPACGGRPCAAVARPVKLNAGDQRSGVAVSVGTKWMLRIPAGYQEIAHNGSVDVYRYPAASGRKELLLHDTSISAFGDLGTHDDWRMYRSDGIMLFFRPVTDPAGWNGFAVHVPANANDDGMLELYAIGFSQPAIEAVLAGIKTRH